MFILNPYAFAAAGGLTLSFVASATSSASTITIPATAQAGDIAVLLQAAIAASNPPTAVTPTGFTNARNNGSSPNSISSRGMIDYRKLTSGDPGDSITGMNGSTNRKIILIFRPSETISTVTPFSAGGSAPTGDPALISISTAGQSAPVVIVGQAFGSSGSVVMSGTLESNGTTVNGASSSHYGVYETQNSTLADRDFDMADFGVNVLQACGFAVS